MLSPNLIYKVASTVVDPVQSAVRDGTRTSEANILIIRAAWAKPVAIVT
jgi:hypothetical protein